MKIQVDIPKEINEKLKIIKLAKNFDTLQEVVIFILDEKSKQIQNNIDEIKKKLK